MNVPFIVGREYTRSEIHDAVGGSRRACLPTREGVVVAACLLESFNPDAPHVMLCGTGPQLTPVSNRLAAQRIPLPIFVKVAVNRWRHAGWFVVSETITSGPRFDAHVARSDRSPTSVSRVVLFEPSSATRRT